MSRNDDRNSRYPAGADVRIDNVRIAVDGIADGRTQGNADRLADAIGMALSSGMRRGNLRIGELSVRVGADQLGDVAAHGRIAAAVARRVFDSLQD